MQRLTVARMREGINKIYHNWSLTSGGLVQQKLAALKELSKYPEFYPTIKKVSKCSRKHRCNNKWCPYCSNPKKRSGQRKIESHRRLVHGTCNRVNTKRGTLSGNYQVRGGQRMVDPFIGIPLILLHPITINLALVPIDGNLREVAALHRKRLYQILKSISPNGTMRGKFDIVLKWVDELGFEISTEDLLAELQDGELPHKRYAMLHAHFVLFDPFLSKQQISKHLCEAYKGKKRVCIRHAYEDIVMPNGAVVRGVQGYLEYTSLEKVELSFGGESTDAVIEFARLDATWTRANKNIRIGKRDAVRTDLIDPARVTELEAAYRKERLKKRWKSLSNAEQFIHRMIGSGRALFIQIKERLKLRTREWIVLFVPVSIRHYILLLSNWSMLKMWKYSTNVGSVKRVSAQCYGSRRSAQPP